MKSVLLTRALEDNVEIVKFLEPKGFDTISCPLLTYRDLPFDHRILDSYSNIIITSKRAAKILARLPSKDLKFWVVGEHSYNILRSTNHEYIYFAKNVADLASRLPSDGLNKFIYLSSNEITMPLPVQRVMIYEVNYSKTLTDEAIASLNRGLDYVVLYSQNCAKTLVTLLIRHNLLKMLVNTTIIAISSKVGEEVKAYCPRVISCTDSNEMMDILINDAQR